MVNAIISTSIFADETSFDKKKGPVDAKDLAANAALSQVAFFLFLADSIEQDGTLTTPFDLQQTEDLDNSKKREDDELTNVEEQP